MNGPQTPGPAVDPPAAGPGPRVPAPPRNDAGGTGDPATVIADDLRKRGYSSLAAWLVQALFDRRETGRERDEARASLAAALAAIARVRALHVLLPRDVNADDTDWCFCGETWPCATTRALEPPGGGT